MSTADLFAAIAAFLTTASFLPQAIRVVRTRDTGAISLAMYFMFAAGVSFWEVYGLLTLQWSIIIANLVTLAFALVILTMKLQDVIRTRRNADPV
ncbi:MAG: SemiSWEET transporter [Hyphomonadaceae bacterium]